MKKTFLISLAIVLALGAFGCARQEVTTDTAGDTSVTTATEVDMTTTTDTTYTDTTMTDTTMTSGTTVTGTTTTTTRRP